MDRYAHLTIKQRMNQISTEMEIVRRSKPAAPKQIEMAAHHWLLAMKAEGCDEMEMEEPAFNSQHHD